ncbi:MAG: radical SAM protein [Paludibacter sp.]
MNKRKLRKAINRLIYLPKNKYLILYTANKIRHFYLKLTKSDKVAYPSTIMLELTNHCNLACSTCPREYDYGKSMDKGNMTVGQAKKIIDEVWPYLDSIGLTGMGETFIHREIEDIVDYIKLKNKGIIISISTNAMLPNFIEAASKIIGKIDTIQISIDGLDEVYESIRKKANFEILDQNLKSLVELCKGTKSTLMLNMVVTKENYFQMPALIRYADSIGIGYMDFSMFNLAAVTNIESSYYKFYRSEEFLETITELKHVSEHTHNVTTNFNFAEGKGFQQCPFPWSHFYICWNGFITPCCAKPFPKELNFGNEFESNLINILNNNSFREFRKLWFENKTPEFCDKCNFTSNL